MKRYCLALDLKNDPELIAQYEYWHQNIWPEIVESINGAGVSQMEIYRFTDRLFMIMEVNDSFSFEKKAAADADNERVQEWEAFMGQFQQTLPQAQPGEKWVLMDKIFQLNEA